MRVRIALFCNNNANPSGERRGHEAEGRCGGEKYLGEHLYLSSWES